MFRAQQGQPFKNLFLRVISDQSIEQRVFLAVGCSSLRPMTTASSKTSFNPSPVRAEHSL